MIAGIVGKMEFERAAWIDANIGQAERHGASQAALVQSDLALRRPVDRGLTLVIRDGAPNILHDDDGRRHRRRFKITQYPPLLLFAGTHTRCFPSCALSNLKQT